MKVLPNPFNLPLGGRANAGGVLTIEFGPPNNEAWDVQQVSIRMDNAPVGATCTLFYMNSFIARANSPRFATAGKEPAIFLQPGERMSVVWEAVTANMYGSILAIHRKLVY